METKEVLLKRLDETVAHLIEVVRAASDPDTVVYEGWSAKDLLGHVTFWHESFARNVADLVHDRKPTPLKGRLSDLNQQGVADLRPCSLEEVIEPLRGRAAHHPREHPESQVKLDPLPERLARLHPRRASEHRCRSHWSTRQRRFRVKGERSIHLPRPGANNAETDEQSTAVECHAARA